MKLHQLVVGEGGDRSRIDVFLARELPQFSRSRLQQLMREGLVRLNGKPARPRDPVRVHDVIDLQERGAVPIETEPEAIPLDVLFEDGDIIVINKPAGLVVHPGAGHFSGTLVNALLHHSPRLSGIGGKERPGIVHRLDKETSGCLVVAKNDLAHHDLARQFAERTIEKVYLAVVAGRLRKGHGLIDAAIGRHPRNRQRMSVETRSGRAATTEYRVVGAAATASLVECRLHSGRTHQIRVHLHHLGHPVLGDKVYGARYAREFPRQMLHARKLGFRHPRTNERTSFEAPLPGDFEQAMRSVGL
jgi:23S rRNA pseudouridine1911/1915/1917 synthase